MNIKNWVVDALTRDEIVDSYFILTDLRDIPVSEVERTLWSSYGMLSQRENKACQTVEKANRLGYGNNTIRELYDNLPDTTGHVNAMIKADPKHPSNSLMGLVWPVIIILFLLFLWLMVFGV